MFHCFQAPGYFIIPQCSIVLWFAWSAHPQMTPRSFGHPYVCMFLQFHCQCQLAVSIMLQTLCGTVMCSCSGQIGLDARWNRALDCGSGCKILQVFVWSDISRETRLWYTLINWYTLIFPSDTVTVISKILHAGDGKLSLQEIPPAFVPSCANWLSYGWLGGDSQHFVPFVEMSGLGSWVFTRRRHHRKSVGVRRIYASLPTEPLGVPIRNDEWIKAGLIGSGAVAKSP